MAYKPLCEEPSASKNLCYYHSHPLNYCAVQFYVNVDE